MARIILSLILSVFLYGSAFAAAAPVSPWTLVADKVLQSVVFLENCSGFVINAEKHYVMTAAHCLAEDETKILVDGTRAYRQFIDNRKDLMVLRAPAVDKPALKLSNAKLMVGDEVASAGFGFAWERPMFRTAHIATVNLESEDLGSGPFVLLDEVLVPGQSGGPIVNMAGDVVAIVQMTVPGYGIGIGRNADVIRDRAGRYFEESK